MKWWADLQTALKFAGQFYRLATAHTTVLEEHAESITNLESSDIDQDKLIFQLAKECRRLDAELVALKERDGFGRLPIGVGRQTKGGDA